jgi:RNA polymerase sigma-32 factor
MTVATLPARAIRGDCFRAPEDQDGDFARNRKEDPALIAAWQETSDPDALATLLRRYAPLINSHASKSLSGRSVGLAHKEDLRQEAALAFISAVNAYDLEVGTSLGSFAIPYVRYAMRRYTLDFRSICRTGTSSGERRAYYVAQKIRAKRNVDHSQSGFSDDDLAEIRKFTGASMPAVRRAVSSMNAHTTSIDEMIECADTHDLPAAVEDRMTRKAIMSRVFAAMEDLTPRAKEIVAESYFTEPATSAAELAARYEVSAERIGQVRRKSLSTIRKRLAEEGIDVAAVF